MKSKAAVAVVTGGASGLGAATANRLAAGGYQVLTCDIEAPTSLDPGAAQKHLECDVADEAAIADVFAEAERTGPLRVVVSCAGRLHSELIYDDEEVVMHSFQAFSELIATNLVGTFNTIRYATRAMCRQAPASDGERGVIVLTSSIAGDDGQIGQLAYAASKAAITGMTLPAARELARHGIRVVTIAPGMFDTAMVRTMPPQVVRALERQIVYPARLGDAGEYASLVEEIVRNRYLNGSVLRLDGATRLGCG